MRKINARKVTLNGELLTCERLGLNIANIGALILRLQNLG